MANFHSNTWIMNNVYAHLKEAFQFFPEDRIVGIFAQGSMNYGLDYSESDVDTKLIVLPTFKDICFNRAPCSTTHIRANDEHIDFKDLRLMLQTFRKQNLNFIEILFTEYRWINPTYGAQWNKLVENNELVAHYNPFSAVKTMKGIAMEKYHAMEHRYPARAAILDKYGYDPKQLHHLIRVEKFLENYIAGKPYKDCLHPPEASYLLLVKTGLYTLKEARDVAKGAIDHIIEMEKTFCESHKSEPNPEVDKLLDTVQERIMYDAMSLFFANDMMVMTPKDAMGRDVWF